MNAGVVVRDGMSADEYHADNSLSSTGARKLLPPSCPAQFKHDREHPTAPKKEFDYGHAAHKLVLGDGPELNVLDFDNYQTKAAQKARDEARDMGAIPLLRHEYEQVQAMADAIRQHPIAGPLLKAGTGIPERSIFWTDEATGVRRRCRPDWLKELPDLTICADYKTIRDASPEAVSKAIRDHGYHQQDPWYCDGLTAAGACNVRFVFVFQAKTAPYLITVRELDDLTRAIGRAKNDMALRVYAECTATGHWPDWTGTTDDIPLISLPTWAAIKEAEEYLQ
ncbi:PD-(D/E)XK nuclease-like domain-containing protein [Streptomyces sp. CS081A]|uniref:PD-(D/E)XK nuclease-like domain-containing protein n=1 Tax=Streptomyces sp. CS081A TaxID=2162709 RepID=UPI001EF6B1B4|nr:PD-(D/E)XK nuclease-like domain-containing protein [Streptomyces sp. CS081A]